MRTLMALVLCLAFPATLVANGDIQCRQMNGRADYVAQPDVCEFDGTSYATCYEYSTRGTINGSYLEYMQEGWDWVWLGDVLPAPNFMSFYFREFSVLTSKQGQIWGDAQYVFNLQNVAIDMGGTAVPIMVTGGSGMYEGAFGWVTFTSLDGAGATLTYDGRVCGPNIPSN